MLEFTSQMKREGEGGGRKEGGNIREREKR
jgi:hypothetical protein